MNANNEQLVRGLGWFSVGLGLAQLLAPRAMSRAIGVNDSPVLMRAIGVREVAAGVGILTQPNRAAWVEGRVAGDVMDLVLLAMALRSKPAWNGEARRKLQATTAAVVGITALDAWCSDQLQRNVKTREQDVRQSIVINRSPEELYRFWRDLENLPRFMRHLESVKVTGPNRSHWVARAPGGLRLAWDSEIVADRPNEFISWRSLEGSDVDHAGSVRFERAPGSRGTVVRVEMHYRPPGGPVFGAAAARLAKLFGEAPEQQLRSDLRPFKQMMETGEVATTDGQPSGRATRSLMERITGAKHAHARTPERITS
jgi:uncharacterized membrane protein